MSSLNRIQPQRVVVVGGGIAALEAVLALHDLADAQLQLTLIAPEPEFVLRPMSTGIPFGRERTPSLPLGEFMIEHGGTFLRSAVLRVESDARRITCTSGQTVPYDVLILALGASNVPAFTHALTFGADPLALTGILADLEQGWSRSVAFVVPVGCTWPLPLYELALLTAEEVWGMGMDQVRIHLVTPEVRPLEVFGEQAGDAVAELLELARVDVHLAARPAVNRVGVVELGDGTSVAVDRIVALPLLEGPRLDGVPSTAGGFFPVDDHGVVAGMDGVYAVGDATDRPVKQGGLACQQADVTAAHIARGAGAHVIVPPLQQVLRGRLLTGMRDRFLRGEPRSGAGQVSDEALWWPPAKVSGRYLAPYLSLRGIVRAAALPPVARSAPPAGLDVTAEVRHRPSQVDPEVFAVQPLGALAPRPTQR